MFNLSEKLLIDGLLLKNSKIVLHLRKNKTVGGNQQIYYDVPRENSKDLYVIIFLKYNEIDVVREDESE